MDDQIRRLTSPVPRDREVALDEMYDLFYYGDPTAEEAVRGLTALQELLGRESDLSVLDSAFRAACGADGFASFVKWDTLAADVDRWERAGRLAAVLTILGYSGDLSQRTLIRRFTNHADPSIRSAALEALRDLDLHEEWLRKRQDGGPSVD
jgi:hypothetical protein